MTTLRPPAGARPPACTARPDAPPGRRTGPAVLAGAAATALGVLAAALLLGGGAPAPSPSGLPDAGPLVGWALPVVRLAGVGAAVATVGLLLTAALLPAGDGGAAVPGRPGLRDRLVRTAVPAAAGWAGLTVLRAVLTAAEVVGVPPSALGTLGGDLARNTLTLPPARACLVSAALAAAVALVAAGTLRGPRPSPGLDVALAAVATVATVVPVRAGHSAAADHATTATWALTAHVAAATLWCGGLLGAAVVVRHAADPRRPLARFSTLAGVCVAVVAASGLVTAAAHLGTEAAAWRTPYGAVLAAKAGVLVALVAFGRAHRRRTLPAVDRDAGGHGAFLRLAAAEVVVMAAALGLAVALSGTPQGDGAPHAAGSARPAGEAFAIPYV